MFGEAEAGSDGDAASAGEMEGLPGQADARYKLMTLDADKFIAAS